MTFTLSKNQIYAQYILNLCSVKIKFVLSIKLICAKHKIDSY